MSHPEDHRSAEGPQDCTQPADAAWCRGSAPRLPVHVGERPGRTGADHHTHSPRADRCRTSTADPGCGDGTGPVRNIARSAGEYGSGGRRDHVAGSRQAGLPPHGLAGVLYVEACAAECVFERLASASVAVSHGDRQECLRRSRRPVVGDGNAFRRRPARACTCERRFLKSDSQRLQAADGQSPGAKAGRVVATTTRVRCAGWSAAWAIR